MISRLAPAENHSPAHYVMGLDFSFSFSSPSLQRLVTDDGRDAVLFDTLISRLPGSVAVMV